MAAELEIVLANGDKAGETLKQLRHQAAALNREISTLKPGTEDFVKTSASLNQVKDRMGDIDKQVKGVSASSNHLKGMLGGVLERIPGFTQMSGAIGSLKGGVGGLTSGFGLLRGAIIATGIGALVILIMSLVTWFTKTEVGADLLAKGMAILSAIFRQLTESISRLIQGDFAGFLRGVTTEMVDQVSAANQLADALDALEEKESAFQVVQKAGLRDKAELLKMSKEETRSLEERVKALDEARAISERLNKEELENQREHLRIISGGADAITDAVVKRLETTGLTMETAKEFFKKGNITQEDLNEANEALGKFLEIQTSGFDEERELLVQRNKLVRKERTEDKKAGEERMRQMREEQQATDAIRKMSNDLTLQRMEEGKQRELQKLEFDTEEKILALQGSEMQIFEQTKLLRELQALEMEEIEKSYADRKAAADQKAKDEAYAREREHEANVRQLMEERAAFEAGLQEERDRLALSGANLAVSLLTKVIGNEQAAKAIRKTLAIGEILMNLQREKAANAVTAANVAASTPGPFGLALYIGTLAKLNTLANVRAGIAAARVLAFRKGGFTGPGANDDVAGVVHANEYVVPAGITNNPAYQPMISALETARLRGYQSGGMVSPRNPFTDRSRSAVSSDSTGSLAGVAVPMDRTDELIGAISTMMTNIKVQNVVTETREAIKTVNTIEGEWSV